jgi:molybdopterin converting factor subunit 1
MKFKIQLFAVARELAGAAAIELDLPPSATVADVRRELIARLPQLGQFGRQLRFAVNSEFADDGTPVPSAAEVACIPPVSGG